MSAASAKTVLRSFRQIPGPPSYPIVGTLLQYSRWGQYDKLRCAQESLVLAR